LLQQQLRNIVPLMKRREAQRFAVKRIRRSSSLEEKAHSGKVTSVDGERERQAAARVWVRACIEQQAHQGDRTVRRGDAQRVIALSVCEVAAQREQRSDSTSVATLHRFDQRSRCRNAHSSVCSSKWLFFISRSS